MSSIKVLRIPIISVLTGLAIHFITMISIRIMMIDSNEWTIMNGDIILGVTLLSSVILFILTGILFFKDMGRKEVFLSGSILSVYNILLIIAQQIAFGRGFYPSFLIWGFIPMNLYSSFTTLVLRFFNISIWMGIGIGMIIPFLYIFFVRKEIEKR